MSGARFLAALRRVGIDVYLLEPDGETRFTASIQPVMRLGGVDAGPLGAQRSRRATLYAPAVPAAERLTEGARLRSGEKYYRVLQVETARLAGIPLYIWAALEPYEGGDAR